MSTGLVDIEMIELRRTAKAVLVKEEELADPVWLPLSQVEIDYTEPHLADVTIPDWLADEKDLL